MMWYRGLAGTRESRIGYTPVLFPGGALGIPWGEGSKRPGLLRSSKEPASRSAAVKRAGDCSACRSTSRSSTAQIKNCPTAPWTSCRRLRPATFTARTDCYTSAVCEQTALSACGNAELQRCAGAAAETHTLHTNKNIGGRLHWLGRARPKSAASGRRRHDRGGVLGRSPGCFGWPESWTGTTEQWVERGEPERAYPSVTQTHKAAGG